jgi:hypothetical protein
MTFQKIQTWFTDNRLQIESILALLSLILVFLKIAGVNTTDELMMLCLSALAVFYFVIGRFLPKNRNKPAFIAIQAAYISFSICTVGLLFSLLHLHGAAGMLEFGIVVMVISGCVLLILWFVLNDKNYIPLLLRIAIFGVILAGFHMRY